MGANSKIKQAHVSASASPYYSGISYFETLRSAVKVPSDGLISPLDDLLAPSLAPLAVNNAPRYKYVFVFHKPATSGQNASCEIHEEDVTVVAPQYMQYGYLFRHLYPRRSVFLDGGWDAVTVFHKYKDDVEIPSAKGDLQTTLLAFNVHGYSRLCKASRKQVHQIIRESLDLEINLAPKRAKSQVIPICASVISTAAFGAPAVYLACHAAMGLASNFAGEVAGAVILGLVALLVVAGLGAPSKNHACYTQVGNKQHLRSHFGQTLFDIYEEREPAQPQAVQATVVE